MVQQYNTYLTYYALKNRGTKTHIRIHVHQLFIYVQPYSPPFTSHSSQVSHLGSSLAIIDGPHTLWRHCGVQAIHQMRSQQGGVFLGA